MSTSAFSSPTRRSWLKVSEQQKSSGLSVAAFCRREAIDNSYSNRHHKDASNPRTSSRLD
jgi:hypothetical protein